MTPHALPPSSRFDHRRSATSARLRAATSAVLITLLVVGLVQVGTSGTSTAASATPAATAIVEGETVEVSAAGQTREEWILSTVTEATAVAGPRKTTPTVDVVVPVGALNQALLDAHPAGTRFGIAEGVHRLTSALRPRTGQQLLGQPGAVLSGAKPLTGWVADGSRWYVTGQTQRLPKLAGPSYDVAMCRAEAPMCNQGEDVFLDGAALKQVGSLREVASGTYYFDYTANRIYIGTNPAGRTVETSVATQAVNGGGDDVVVRDLVIEKFGNQAQLAAVHDGWKRGWVVEHNEIRLNHGVGVQMYGGVLRANVIRSNGQLGIGGGGDGLLVEGNEIAHNNAQGYNPYWEAGGTKWAHSKNLVVRRNWSHHNGGPGLWTDIDNQAALYEGNLVEDNDMAGIMHEISYAATVRENVARRNGGRVGWYQEGAGILVFNSRDVTVSGNVVSDNAAGVAVRNDHRPPYETRNVTVTGNEIRMSTGRTGLVDTTKNAALFTSHGITFSNNTYVVPHPNARWFEWSDQLGKTFDQWKGYGHDAIGTVDTPPSATPDLPGTAPSPRQPVTDGWNVPEGSGWSPSAWVRTNGLSGSVRDVRSDQGRMTTGASAPYSWSVAEPVGGARADGEVLVTFSRRDGVTEGYVDLWQRASDNGGGPPTSGYKVEAGWHGGKASLYLRRVADGTSTWLGTLKASPGAGEAVTVRFRTKGTTIAAKAWPAGTAEPSSWDVEVSDATIASGTRRIRVMTGATPSDVDVRFDDFRDTPM